MSRVRKQAKAPGRAGRLQASESAPPRQSGIQRLKAALAPLALAGLVLAVFSPAISAGFLWDDTEAITNNFLLRSLHGLWVMWTDPFRSPLGHYFPLSYTTFWMEWRIWGSHPAGYHAVNILLHAANAALLYSLLRRIGLAGAWLAAGLFAVHPVQVASVAWVIERKNVLSVLFYLLSFRAWLDAESRGRPAHVLSLALFACAMLSKSIVVTLPVAFLICVWWRSGRIGRKHLFQALPFLAIGALLAWVEVVVHHSGQPDRGLSMPDKGLIAGRALWFYASKLCWPRNLMQVYPQWAIDPRQAWQWLFPLGAAAAFGALWVSGRRLGRGPFAAAAFYAVGLSPILGFVQYSVMDYSYVHDQHQYLACIGVFALAAAALNRLAGRLARATRACAAACKPALFAIVLAPLAFLSWKQTLLYKDMDTLFRDNLKKNPAAWLAYGNVGAAALQRGDLDQAEPMLRKALEMKRDRTVLTNAGLVAMARGDLDQAERMQREALEMERDACALNNLGLVLSRKGRPQEALACFDEALETRPDNALLWNNKGKALTQLGRSAEACEMFRQALAMEPRFSEARTNLAGALIDSGQDEEAKTILAPILESEPNNAAAHAALALALQHEKRETEAVAGFRWALQLDPGRLATANNLAWILATSADPAIRDPEEAVRLGEMACQGAANANPAFLDTLGVAYAAAGRFEEAVRTEEKAIDQARAEGKPDLLMELEHRREMFQQGRPFSQSDQ